MEQKNIVWFKDNLKVMLYPILCFLILPAVCFADGVDPFFFLLGGVPLTLLMLFVILAIEFPIIRFYLSKKNKNFRFTWKEIITATFWANVASTVAGVPLLYLIAPIGTLFAAVSTALKANSFFTEIIDYSALATYIIISFLLSVWLESTVAYWYLGKVEKENIKKAVWLANAFSYAFCTPVLLFLLSLSLKSLTPNQ
jgi:hypothetical protein